MAVVSELQATQSFVSSFRFCIVTSNTSSKHRVYECLHTNQHSVLEQDEICLWPLCKVISLSRTACYTSYRVLTRFLGNMNFICLCNHSCAFLCSCPLSEIRKIWNPHQGPAEPWAVDARDWAGDRCFQAEKERTEKPLPQWHWKNVWRQINSSADLAAVQVAPSHASVLDVCVHCRYHTLKKHTKWTTVSITAIK